MARGLGRSKGCQNCLQRKIKCDEKTPSCTQCRRGGRQCSGALSTVFLIVESETVNTNPTYKPRGTENTSKDSHGEYSTPLVRRPKKNYHAARKSSRRKAGGTTSELDAQNLPRTVQSAHAIADQFLSKFISFFARVSPQQVLFNSWLTALPNMLVSRSIAVEKAIIAATMVYAGRDSGNATVVAESYKWYGFGIAKQRRMLEELQCGNRMPTVEEICTPILLSFFEITCNTSPTGYFQHLMGAARLLEMRGPEDCSSGTLHRLFLTLRIQLIHQAIVTRTPSVFATEEWLTIPFQVTHKSVFDRIIDAITIISSILSRVDATRSTKYSTEAEQLQSILRAEAKKIKEQLDQCWDKELRNASQIHGWNGDRYRGVPGFDFDCLNSEPTMSGSATTVQSPDKHSGGLPITFASTERMIGFYADSRSITFYNTARILIISILNELDATPALFQEQMQAHCESILSRANFLTNMDIGYAYVRLVLPLTLVSRLSRLDNQKIRAKEILSRWKLKGGVAGLCDVVLSDLEGEVSHAQTSYFEQMQGLAER